MPSTELSRRTSGLPKSLACHRDCVPCPRPHHVSVACQEANFNVGWLSSLDIFRFSLVVRFSLPWQYELPLRCSLPCSRTLVAHNSGVHLRNSSSRRSVTVSPLVHAILQCPALQFALFRRSTRRTLVRCSACSRTVLKLRTVIHLFGVCFTAHTSYAGQLLTSRQTCRAAARIPAWCS